jgi:hypothetical protein
MSNYLAIATVTATLQRLLQASVQQDVLGAKVTTVKPDAAGGGTPDLGVNIYLYHATPNPAWRNADLRTRRPKGDLIKHGQAGLDLYYLMSFYGNEAELEPQRLLGSTVRSLIDQPTLTPEFIRATIADPVFSRFIHDSTLADQIERVTFMPSVLTTEDLSKVWSVLFQTPYVLSFAYQGGAVLIEGDRPSSRGLPIRSRQFYATPNQPTISRFISDEGSNQPITTSSTLTILGRNLRHEAVQVQIGEAKFTPKSVTETQLVLNLAELDRPSADLRAGIQSLQVLHPVQRPRSSDPEYAIASNTLPIVLCPLVRRVGLEEMEAGKRGIWVELDLEVERNQRVFLFLNPRKLSSDATAGDGKAMILAASARNEVTQRICFSLPGVKAGRYLVRVQVDGAETPLEFDQNPESETFEEYIDPTVVVD